MRKEFDLIISKIKNRRKLYFGITAALISAGIAAVIPYIYGRLIDIAIAPNSQIKIILGLIFLWLVLSFLNNGLSRFVDKKAYEIYVEVFNGLFIDFFHQLILLPMKFHKEHKMGKVMKRIDHGIETLCNMIERTIFKFAPNLISFFIALIILFFVEWRLSLILTISAILYILATIYYTKGIVKKQKIMNRAWDKAFGDLWDSVLNVEAVKASTNEEFERKRNIKNHNRAGEIFKNWRLIWIKMGFWQGIIFAISFVSVVSIGAFMLRNGELTAGQLIMFIGYTSLLTAPLAQLADQYRLVRTSIINFSRAMKYYEMPPEKDLPFSKDIKDLKGEVIFENVDFGYKKDKLTAENISFKAEAGENIALVGESGVGKSTLVGLISRYYLPLKGKILIDGIDIKKITLKSLRERIAIVPQEVLLFNDTIKNNIRYGKTNATDKEIIEAAKAANANEFIENFSKKYDTLVGERGIKLSTGQKQRIAIARAILRNPRILILDEATSALDSVSEKLVQEALNRLIKNRTTFIIAHRLSTIQHSNKIIVIEKGRIAEMGNHKELMENPKGIYRNFWEMQTAIEKIH
ncbi:MAG: ABC transporter ATP-binding protein [Patescibacteria group bacterium]